MANMIPEETLVAQEIMRQLPLRAKQEADIRGPGPGIKAVTPSQEIALWNERDQNVDIWSEYNKARAEGTDEQSAKDKASLLAYPNRGKMLLYAGSTDAERTAYADKMQRLSQSPEGGTE